MPYNGNIPQPTDQISQSQNQILDNFTAIQTVVAVNHVTFDDPSGNQGKHKWVSFPVQTGAPSFAAGENGLYSLAYNNNTTTKNEIFTHKQTSSGTQNIPFTAGILSANSAPATLTPGWTYLPSGILLKWSANEVANGLTVINFPAGAPVFNVCMTVIVQVADGGAGDINRAIRLTAVNPTNFSVYGSSRTTTGAASMNFTYLAIGY